MNEGWVADWIASGASPPASPPAARERTASERLQAAREEERPWLDVGWGDHVVAGDVIWFEEYRWDRTGDKVRWAGSRGIVAEVLSAVWDARNRLYFGLFVLDGELVGQRIRRQGRTVYGRSARERPWRLRWDDEGARAELAATAHREFEAAGDASRSRIEAEERAKLGAERAEALAEARRRAAAERAARAALDEARRLSLANGLPSAAIAEQALALRAARRGTDGYCAACGRRLFSVQHSCGRK